jgi:CPA1 family monovalent cation:H+ antiporter
MEYTLVLALAVPPLAQRDLLITVTFGVVLLSILLQGLTIKPLLHRLAIVRHDARQRYDIKRGEIRMTQAALDEIAQLERLHGAPPALLRELSEETRRGRARLSPPSRRCASSGTIFELRSRFGLAVKC